MAGALNLGGKRELLARGLLWSGASLLNPPYKEGPDGKLPR
jgi:hypothetical protein